jgi:ABC-type molybdate transport system permease subunit
MPGIGESLIILLILTPFVVGFILLRRIGKRPRE